MKGRYLGAAALVVVMLGVAGALVSRRTSGTLFGFGAPDHAPTGSRVRVQVLNATASRGLAQRATDHLRDNGFDVVEIGNNHDKIDTTLVLDRSNHPDWARRVAAAMGGAKVLARPDSSRYLDVTVLIGATWRPPTQPFHP
jgi:hypothetical protein